MTSSSPEVNRTTGSLAPLEVDVANRTTTPLDPFARPRPVERFLTRMTCRVANLRKKSE